MLPIEQIIPQLRRTLSISPNAVLVADPGAGKTTRIPIALVNEPWLREQKIIMLEPRRLAAIRSAEYMAEQMDERAGETVGYRIRGDVSIGKRTRIEVVTEGILTRMLQDDQSLHGIGLVIFDEFHERSIHADLGLALVLDVQQQLRNDLRILVMSATLDGSAVSSLMGNAPIIKSEGRMFPVQTHYLQLPRSGEIESAVAAATVKALREHEGDILAFLPGQHEIRRTESLLSEHDLASGSEIHCLFGDASPEKQRAALHPSRAGKRKVILSTSIAETSLTIDGIRIVIDSGLARSASFDPRRGMPGLVTHPVSQAAADQRRGRAGRQQPGICYRLWTQPEHHLLPKYSQPEILVADLTSFALELAQWGDPFARRLKFLDPLPQKNFTQARSLLIAVGALDEHGTLTAHGKEISRLGVHPRIAHMMVRGKELGLGSLACDVAALLEEKDLLRGRAGTDIDFISRYFAFHEGKSADRFTVQRAREQSRRLRAMLGIRFEHAGGDPSVEQNIGKLLALAYPDRVAKRREKSGKYQLSGNTVGIIPKESALSTEEYLAVADVDGSGSEVKIFLAAPVTKEDILELFSERIETAEEIFWDQRLESIVGRRVTRFGAIELSQQTFDPPQEQSRSILCDAIRSLGLVSLPWDKESESFRARSEWLRMMHFVAGDWPDLSDEHLMGTLADWLAPYLQGVRKRSQFSQLNMMAILKGMFTYQQQKELDRLAPAHLVVPTGSRIPIDYSTPQPVLAVRLQEMFGETETPAVGGGKVKVLLHLLSPARRPLAVTQDLPSFWKNGYQQVRKDMRGEYPKHYWPENPLEAEPTKRTKRHLK